jgi:hypothetical protein
MHFLKGEATVTLGDDVKQVGPGAWFQMGLDLRNAV